MFTYCIDTTELIGNFVSIENICEPNSVDFVNFIVGDSICITILADAIGIDTACIVICDDLGNCDTTIIIVTVLPDSVQLIPPIAVDDAATTVINSSVVIEVLENDTLNGTLTSIVILEDPEYGTATVTADNNIEYAPFQDVCDVIDSFTYVIGNGIGFDTATVTVEILCDSITIFSGFSPNNDGVNDVFTILGLDNFPDNTLLIFNRWGNQVFETMNYQNNWDGKWDGKDLPDGTYFYVLDLGNGEKLSGYVQIHR
jgi:gliding motility-associated-like protein